jgi:hypothetical protein
MSEFLIILVILCLVALVLAAFALRGDDDHRAHTRGVRHVAIGLLIYSGLRVLADQFQASDAAPTTLLSGLVPVCTVMSYMLSELLAAAFGDRRDARRPTIPIESDRAVPLSSPTNLRGTS